MNKYTQGNITVYANSWKEALIMINEIRNIEKDFYLNDMEEF